MTKGRQKAAGAPKQVETLTHTEAKRKNIPTAELQPPRSGRRKLFPSRPSSTHAAIPLLRAKPGPAMPTSTRS